MMSSTVSGYVLPFPQTAVPQFLIPYSLTKDHFGILLYTVRMKRQDKFLPQATQTLNISVVYQFLVQLESCFILLDTKLYLSYS